LQKARFLTEKRQWSDVLQQTESQIRKDEELRRTAIEEKLKNTLLLKDQMQIELDQAYKRLNSTKRDHSDELETLNHEKARVVEELRNSQEQIARLTQELFTMKTKIQSALEIEREAQSKKVEIQNLSDELNKSRKENEKLVHLLNERNVMISRLKEQIKRRDEELDSVEEANAVRMKELQMSINSLLSTRTKRRTISAEIQV
jgi:chromosome segregation ATPase